MRYPCPYDRLKYRSVIGIDSAVLSSGLDYYLLVMPVLFTIAMSTVEKINSPQKAHPQILCTYVEATVLIPGIEHIPLFVAHATKVPGLISLSSQTPVGPDGQVVEGGIKEHIVCLTKELSARWSISC